MVGCRHLADEGDRLGRNRWSMSRCGSIGLPAPEAAKEVPMPAQQGIGLDDEQGLAPRTKAAGEQHKQCSVGWGAAWARRSALQDDQLLAEECILGNEFSPTPPRS